MGCGKLIARIVGGGLLLALFVAEVSAEAGAVIADEGGDALAKRSLEEAWMWGKRGEAARADACLDAAEAAMESGGPINARHSVAVKLMRGHFAEKRGKFEEARRFFDAAEASLTADVPDEVRFLVLEERLRWLHVHGELREGSLAEDELLTLAELRRDPERISRYSEDSGMILFKLRNLNGAEARASRALEAATEANLQVEIGKAKKLQGAIANQRRDFDLALRLYREALSIFNGLGENHQIANCHYHIATVATEKNDRAAARIHIDEAVAFFTDAGALRGVGLCRMLDGQSYLKSGDLLRAAERLEEAERIFVRARDRHSLGTTKELLAGLASLRGEKAKSAELMQEARRLLGPGVN